MDVLVVQILPCRIPYYLKVCTSANELTRESFTDLVQTGNSLDLKPKIYDLLIELQNQVAGFQNLKPSPEQVLSIKETLKQIVDLALEQYLIMEKILNQMVAFDQEPDLVKEKILKLIVDLARKYHA